VTTKNNENLAGQSQINNNGESGGQMSFRTSIGRTSNNNVNNAANETKDAITGRII